MMAEPTVKATRITLSPVDRQLASEQSQPAGTGTSPMATRAAATTVSRRFSAARAARVGAMPSHSTP